MRKTWRAALAFLCLSLGTPGQAAEYRVPGRVSGPVIAAPIVAPGISLSALCLTPPTATPALQAPALQQTPLPSPTPLLSPAPDVLIPTEGSALSVGVGVQQALRKSAAPSEILSNIFDGQAPAASFQGAPVIQPGRNIIGSPHPQTLYLAPSQAKSGRALLDELHAISGLGYITRGYDEAKSYMFSTSDNIMVDGKHGLIDAYSGIFVPGTSGNGNDYPEPGDSNHDGFPDKDGMNVEHTWPQSFFDKRLPMKSDLHQLLATFMHPNGVRGHLPFGEVQGPGDYHNDAGAKRGQGVFEPPDFVKGKVARAVLYFYTRYNDRNITNGAYNDQAFWNGKLEMFLRWNKRFPPDEMELRRNDLIEKFQGNRNPFIDDPALADRVGIEGFKRGLKLDRIQLRQSLNMPVSQRRHRRR